MKESTPFSIFQRESGYRAKVTMEKLKISESYYLKLMCGQRSPGADLLRKIKAEFPETDMNIFFKSEVH